MCGVGFSGKSTLAKKIVEYTGAILISQDETFFKNEKELNLDPDSDIDWKKILNICRDNIRTSLKNGDSVVFDDTSHKLRLREKLRVIANECGAETRVIFLDTPMEIQKERQEKNKITKERHDVKDEYLNLAIAELEVPTEDEHVFIYKPNANTDEFLKSLI